jgi:hypothetical protein
VPALPDVEVTENSPAPSIGSANEIDHRRLGATTVPAVRAATSGGVGRVVVGVVVGIVDP